MKKSRKFQLTINNPTEEDGTKIKAIICQYCIYCYEEAPKTGTKHVHVFIYYRTQKTWKDLKDLFPVAHIEVCKGSIKENIAYIKKHGNWKEYGECPQQGRRCDIEDLCEKINKGADLYQIAQEMPSMIVKYSKGIEKLISIRMIHRSEGPIVTWYWGPTGVGKTRTACQTGASVYIKDHTQWWDGYKQQETIVIDDFDVLPSGKPCWPFRDLLRLLDRYPYAGQYKGGYIPIKSKNIIITSEFPPEHFWQSTQLAQVRRRIKESGGAVIHMHPPLLRRTPSLDLEEHPFFNNDGSQTDEPCCSTD